MMKLKTGLLLVIGFFMMTSCHQAPSTLYLLNKIGRPEVPNFRGWVLMVMVPDCPWAIKYGHDFEMLGHQYLSKGFRFVIIAPGVDFSESDYANFKEEIASVDSFYRDHHYELTKKLKATISPEFFIVDTLGVIRYSGAFDNRVTELGKAKLKATEPYLKSALDSLIAGKDVKPKKTNAVGCYLEIP